MPTIGQEIRCLRETKGWDQKSLCDRAGGLDYSVLSRIESGKTKVPNYETLRRLATALEVPADNLLSLAAGLKQRDGTTVRLGVAHGIWAAPLFLLAMRGRLPGVSITSYGLASGSASNALGDAFWYHMQASAGSQAVKAGPAWVRCGAPQCRGVQEWSVAEPLRVYTADDIVDLLSFEPPHLDGLVAVHEAIKSYSKRTIRCARIVRVEDGCSLLLGMTRKVFESLKVDLNRLRSSDEEFIDLWDRVTVDSIPALPTLCAPGTIAEQHLNLLREFRSAGKPTFDSVRYVELGDWNEVVATARKALGIVESEGDSETRMPERKGQEPCGALAFIGWEPHMSWLEAELARIGAVSFRLSRLSKLMPGKRVPPVSFDISLREGALSGSSPGTGFRAFLNLLDGAVQEVRAASGPMSSAVQLIARYLNMDPSRCFESLAGLEFELLYYPEWVDYLQD